MNKKAFLLCTISLLLSSCGGNVNSNETTTEITPSVTKTLDSKVYTGMNDTLTEITGGDSLPTTFFDIAKDVPYVTLNDFITYFNSLNSVPPCSVDGETITNLFTNEKLVFDVKKNTIYAEDLDQFLNFSETSVPFDVFSATVDAIATIDESRCKYTKGASMTFNLNDFNAKIVEYDNKVYVPFGYLADIFMTVVQIPFGFNGSDYYITDLMKMFDYLHSTSTNLLLNEYGKNFYAGEYSKMTTRSESFANYFYYSFVFEMQYFNGKFPTLGITSLDAKLEEDGLKEKMLSLDSETADAALGEVINTYFLDGGHTMYTFRGVTCPYSLQVSQNIRNGVLTNDSRYIAKENIKKQLNEQRVALKTLEFDESKTTAVIRFDSFSQTSYFFPTDVHSIDEMTYPTVSQIEEEVSDATSKGMVPSTFALLYTNFKTISETSTVQNVVFDVSQNGGGAATALAYALSFLTDDPVEMNFKNPITGATYTLAASYDNDLNKETKNDSYEGKYNFFILTSMFSFSCGNAFPCVAQDYDLATIIGQTSGGGDCSVTKSASAESSSWQMSSTSMITFKNGQSVDGGAPVDYEYPLSDFYDMEKLNTFVNSINN